MCGIFGYLKAEGVQIEAQQRERVASLLHHRGPDHWGFWENEKILFLHTRLKILDLDDRANQPFFSENNRFLLLYNGESYNFKSLKRQLEGLGHYFRTSSDTEVILKAFIEWGKEFIHKVAGMFSIIIHDRESDETFIWRDRLGIKPLYIFQGNDGIIFSSEIKPILLFQRASLNVDALGSYFNLRYVAGSSTLFKGIHEVPPGAFIICRSGKVVSQTTYWDCRKVVPQRETQLLPDEFLSHFKEVVSEHNVADVKVGCFLSGGVDSASIAAVSAAEGFLPEAYTLSTGLSNDEKDRALGIARNAGISQEIVGISDASFELYKKALWHLEDPIGDSIIVPTLLLARGAGKKHRVVLSGEGADEIFSGYVHHQFLNLEDRVLQKIPTLLWHPLGKLAGLLPLGFVEKIFPYPAKLGESGWSKVLEHLNHLEDSFERYMSLVGLFYGKAGEVFSQRLELPSELKDFWTSMEDMPFADKLKRFDLYFWGRNYTLHRLDRLTMASSLEGRVPFFDHRLVELILSLPAQRISSFRDPKVYFRRSLKKTNLPPAVIQRKKQAFFLPSEKVFDGATLLKAKEEILENSKRRGIFNRSVLEKLLFKDGPELLDSKQFQVLYHFELWSQMFLDRKIE